MNPFIRNLALSCYRRTGISALKHFRQRSLFKILCYHRFVGGKEKPIVSRKFLKQDSFARQISYLKSRFDIKTVEECISFRNQAGKFPPNTLALTIDDGYEDFYLYAYPILKHFGIPATMYLVYDFIEEQKWLWQDKIKYGLRKSPFKRLDIGGELGVIDMRSFDSLITSQLMIYDSLVTLPPSEREDLILRLLEILEVELPSIPLQEFAPLNWDKIKEMSDNGIQFGSHTCSHEVLPTVTRQELKHEIEDSKALIEKKTGHPVQTFCYPHGKINNSVVDVVSQSGYLAAVTGVGANDSHADIFRLARIYEAEVSFNYFVYGLYES